MDDLVAAQQREIETLRERIRQLEQELCPPRPTPVEWGLTGQEAAVYNHLASRPQASKRSIMQALYSDRAGDEPAEKIIDVFVCKMRRKLKPFGVEIRTVWGQGYALAASVDDHGTRRSCSSCST